MNSLRNKVQLIGHLGSAPEIKTLDGGKSLLVLILPPTKLTKMPKVSALPKHSGIM